jgi:tetratricopeptide (TPR) repeat protein
MNSLSSSLPEPAPTLAGQRIALLGPLAGMSKREAARRIREQGGVYAEKPDAACTLVVWGEAELPLAPHPTEAGLLDEAARTAAERGSLVFISETELWQRLGLVETQHNVHRLYTPAMLAELLGVAVAVIRRWHRRGLIVPVREVHRLPYFDFCEVSTARRLAELLAAGCSPVAIERQLAELQRFLPSVDRPLAQLSVIIQGKQLLLRQGEGLLEPGGQYRFDFEADRHSVEAVSTELAGTHELREISDGELQALEELNSPDSMRLAAAELEDGERLSEAAEMYRAALAAGGPHAETNFRLAELLYRQGDTAGARERYYVAIEIDEDYVEARANLGCVLAELGERELAVAAFRGALAFHADYPDAHYHLARTLDELERPDQAAIHWQSFLQLASDSPWADEARSRLDIAAHDAGE